MPVSASTPRIASIDACLDGSAVGKAQALLRATRPHLLDQGHCQTNFSGRLWLW